MARRLLALAFAIAIGLLGACAVALTPGCAWMQAHPETVGELSEDACLAATIALCVDSSEAELICKAAHTATELAVRLEGKNCPLDAGHE